MQTVFSREAGELPTVDEKDNSHSTRVASKASGQKHGIAKGTTLISVKFGAETGNWEKGMARIAAKIKRLGREKTSVVLMSVGTFQEGWENRDKALASKFGQDVKARLDTLHNLGVPVVLSAGNYAPGRPNLDQIPQVLEGPGIPLINVGAAEYDGTRSKYSQGGNRVFIYAPGKADVQEKQDGKTSTVQGTSYGKLAPTSDRHTIADDLW
jgi:hypothetical protein